MSSSNIAQIHNLYTSSFPRLTNEHYATVEWPEVEVVSCLVDNNEVFAIFYRELYFRHIYSRLQPNIDDRFSSYENYCAIFNYILNSDGPVPIELPVQWLWDLVDEFVWQFASFSQCEQSPQLECDQGQSAGHGTLTRLGWQCRALATKGKDRGGDGTSCRESASLVMLLCPQRTLLAHPEIKGAGSAAGHQARR